MFSRICSVQASAVRLNGCRCVLQNGFFESNLDPSRIRDRLLELENGKVGFYSVGCTPFHWLTTAPCRQRILSCCWHRDLAALFGAFKNDIAGMDPDHLATVEAMGSHLRARSGFQHP